MYKDNKGVFNSSEQHVVASKGLVRLNVPLEDNNHILRHYRVRYLIGILRKY